MKINININMISFNEKIKLYFYFNSTFKVIDQVTNELIKVRFSNKARHYIRLTASVLSVLIGLICGHIIKGIMYPTVEIVLIVASIVIAYFSIIMLSIVFIPTSYLLVKNEY